MKIVIYQAVILAIIVMSNDVDSVTVELSQNGTRIKCSYSLENVLKIDLVSFRTINDNTALFEPIVTYLPDIKSLITTRGKYLNGRVELSNITQLSTKAVMVFNKLLCIDDTLYQCYVRYVDTDGVGLEATSNKIGISVQVPPSTPDSISLVHMPAELPVTMIDHIDYSSISPAITTKEHETVSALQSVTLNNTTSLNYSTLPKTNYDTTSSILFTDDLSSKISVRTTTYSTQHTAPVKKIVEGDNITVVCTGDVGKPPAEYFFEKYLNRIRVPMQDTVITTFKSEMPENCSYHRTSNLTFQVTADDKNVVIRCVVLSSMAKPDMYVETAPIEVFYEVRKPTIVKYPNKTDYVLGEDTSIRLTCKSDGNPKPSYYWYKESPKKQVSSNENFTITNLNIKDSGTYKCAVDNTFHGDLYQKVAVINIKIINAADKSTPSTSGSEDNKETGIGTTVIATITVPIVIGVILVLMYVLYRKRRKKKEITELSTNLIESQNTTPGEPSTYSTKKTTGYEEIDLVVTDKKSKPESNEDTIAKVEQQNEEDLQKQKEEEDNKTDNPTTLHQAAVYACVNKPKYTVATENKPSADQPDEDVYEDSKDGIYDISGKRRHKDNITVENYDSTENLKNEESDQNDILSDQKIKIGGYMNKSYEHDSGYKEEKRQVATVSPTVRLSSSSQGDGQEHKSNEIQPKTEKQTTHETSL